MSLKLDPKLQELMMRTAVAAIIESHIEVRCVQTGRVLVKGTYETTAHALIKPWQIHTVHAFFILARGEGAFHAKRQLAQQVGGTASGIDKLWKRIRKLAVLVRPSEGGSVVQTNLLLFRGKHECFYSDAGLKLVLNASMLGWADSKRITNSQAEATRVAQDNYEGACLAQEADASKSEVDRVAARQRLAAQRDEVSAKSQPGLFDITKAG